MSKKKRRSVRMDVSEKTALTLDRLASEVGLSRSNYLKRLVEYADRSFSLAKKISAKSPKTVKGKLLRVLVKDHVATSIERWADQVLEGKEF